MTAEKIIILQNTLKYLRQQQVWPKNDGLNTPRISYFRFFLMHVWFLLTLLGTSLHLIISLKSEKVFIIGVAEDIVVLLAGTGDYLFILTFYIKQKQMAELYLHMSDFRKFGKPRDFDETCKKMNFLAWFFAYYIFFGVILYGTSKILRIPHCRALNEQLGFDEVCGLFVSSWVPDRSPTGIVLVFGYQAITLFLMMRSAWFSAFSNFEIAQHLVIRINDLKEKLEKVFDEETYFQRRLKLDFCIEYHNFIIGLHKEFVACYRVCMSCHLTMTGLIISSILYQLLLSISPEALIHLAGWFAALFLNSWGSQILINESSKITQAAYNSRWYEVEVDLQKNMKMIMMSAQKPFYNYGGPFGALSFEMFLKVVKTSYSYLAVLKKSL